MHQTIICITETQYNEWTERLKVLGNQEIQLSTNHVIRQLKPIVYDKMSLWPINAFSHILSAVMLHFKIFTGYWTTCITIFYSLKTRVLFWWWLTICELLFSSIQIHYLVFKRFPKEIWILMNHSCYPFIFPIMTLQ